MTQELFRLSLIILISIFGSIVAIYEFKSHSDGIKLANYELNIKSNVDDSIVNLLDSIIESAFEDFLLMHPEYQDNIYINAEIEKEMLSLFKDTVMSRLSVTVMDKLSLYYNRASIPTIITDKMRITITAFAATNNVPRE
jgi:hypothetical protein